ncbi:MAG TPA: integrase [Frateuria sp.]|uniref:integrase n=1 Tax=Frateuria sp. TaxID=2211372 RepID=UPI002DE513D4|nr:integrase [Frateuria sp.]
MKTIQCRAPRNKGKLIGQKAPLRLRELWAIRVRLQLSGSVRDLALFNVAIDSKLRSCDLVNLRARYVSQGAAVSNRAIVLQRKTNRPVQFEITEQTRAAFWHGSTQPASVLPTTYSLAAIVTALTCLPDNTLVSSMHGYGPSAWIPYSYGTHSMRRTKVALIYRQTKNLRAVQLLLGHTKLESTVRYLGVEVDDALELAEQPKHDRFRPGADLAATSHHGFC